MLYFTYGSNLCVSRLNKRGADPSNPRIARLDGYELRFNKKSNDGSSKANVTASDGSSEVWGVVFDISDNKLEGLRQAEGFPNHYSEEAVEVFVADQQHLVQVTTYVAHPNRIVEGINPYDWYLDHIVKGGERFGLPTNYLIRISKVQTIADPDTDRTKRERGYWADETS